MAKTSWKDEFYVTVYELARDGVSETQMAKSLGVSTTCLRRWKKSKPALGDAIERGRVVGGGMSPTAGFHEYIFQKLPPHLAELYNEIEAVESEPNGIQRVEAMLVHQGKRARQHLFLHALVTSNFNVSRACSTVNISRKTFESWVTSEPDFQELIQEMDFHKKNYFESALVALVARGDSSATIFVNKTINRDRGYNEKLDVNVSGNIEHQHSHSVISMKELSLPLEVRRIILAALREKKGEIANANGNHRRLENIPGETTLIQ
jgi:hypothetical protein